jgi:hypothetical protein
MASRPSYYAVSTEDRTINPDLERFMAKRMGAKTIEVQSSHLSLISHPAVISVAMPLLLLALRLREFGRVQTEVGDRLFIKLSRRLHLLALLELLHGVLGFVAPASIRPSGLEAVFVERLLDLTHVAARQALWGDRLAILRRLLLVILLVLLILGILLVLMLILLHLLPLRRLLLIVRGCESGRRNEHSSRD